jgi:trans-2-enoyl-CoA reductase
MESNIENIETRSITQVKQVMNNIDKVVKSISASKEKEAARQTEAYNASVRRTTLRKTER